MTAARGGYIPRCRTLPPSHASIVVVQGNVIQVKTCPVRVGNEQIILNDEGQYEQTRKNMHHPNSTGTPHEVGQQQALVSGNKDKANNRKQLYARIAQHQAVPLASVPQRTADDQILGGRNNHLPGHRKHKHHRNQGEDGTAHKNRVTATLLQILSGHMYSLARNAILV